MSNRLQTIKSPKTEFIEIPPSVRMAILLPTARWNHQVRSILAAFVGVASEEVAVLIADNSENKEKHKFLGKLMQMNPCIQAIAHKKNIGAANNFYYLHDWSRNTEFTAIMADDDAVSPTYYLDAYAELLKNPQASCISAGTTFVDVGDGHMHNVSQPSMLGATPLERMQQWSSTAARVTMYDASRTASLAPALAYLQATPISGLTLMEDLYELSRLSRGDFIKADGHGFFVHYPHHGAQTGEGSQRFYELLCKPVGLNYYMVYFMALSTAVQCAMFLLGKYSPIQDQQHKMACAQHVFKKIFVNDFLPKLTGPEARAVVKKLFASSPDAMAGFDKYCNTEDLDHLVFDLGVLNWFIQIIGVFEERLTERGQRVSEEFKNFCMDVLG